MKNQYEKPVMVAETFTPNNFVSSCDWWKVETTLSHYFYDYISPYGKFQQGEEIVNISSIYFKLSDNNNVSLNNDLITIQTPSQPSYNIYKSHKTNGQYQYSDPYNDTVYSIKGTQTKGSSSTTTYWYTSNDLSFTKAAS